MRDRSILLGSLTVVLAATGFGMLGPLARFAYERGIDPLSFVAWRAAIGALTVVGFIAWQLRRGTSVVNPLRLPRRDGIGLSLAALAGLTLNVAMFVAFDLSTVALVLLAFYTYPAMVAVVAIALGHEPLDRGRLTALGLSSIGTVLVVAGGFGAAGDPGAASGPGSAGDTGAVSVVVHPLGLLLGLAAAVSQTVFVTISRGRFRQVPVEQATGWILIVSAIASAILAAASGGAFLLPLRDGQAFGLTVLAGVAAAGIPSVLFLRGIRTIGGTRAGTLMLFEPLVGVALAALLLHEGLVVIQVVGGAAILGGALLLQRSPGQTSVESLEHLEPAGVPSIERP